MALITCPSCGKEISDRSKVCIHCGYDLSNLKEATARVCPECGMELEEGAEVCPNCGCPIETSAEENEQGEPAGAELQQADSEKPQTQEENSGKKKRRKGLIAIILVIVAAAVIAIGFGAHAGVKHQKENAYASDLSEVTYDMLESSVNAESAGNLIKSVWNNCIFEKSDSTTDPYTKNSSGSFYDDFNTALLVLFSDEDFMTDIATIEMEQDSITSKIKEMQDPPEKWAEAYGALLDYYDAYNTLANLVVNPSGSLQTFSSNFNDADTAAANAYQKMGLYLD